MSGPARVLIVAGSDSGGGAGIQADLKTVTMLGGYGMTAVAAITAQNTLGVQAVHPVPTNMVVAQLTSCLDDIGADAVKLGMVGSAATAHAIADVLEGLSLPVVFDPVMVATSGDVLAEPATIAAFARLLGLATVATPNLPELAALGGRAAVLAHGCHLVEKGGHAAGATVIDRLFAPDGHLLYEKQEGRIATTSIHGTGCTFASALAWGLAAGYSMTEAFGIAVDFVRAALHAAPGLGHGHGPLGHQRVIRSLCLPASTN